MGPRGVSECLNAGANDLGGTLMNESITRAAGASFGEELPPEEMESVISLIKRTAKQRSTAYGEADELQMRKSYNAADLLPIIQTPAAKWTRDAESEKPILVRPGLEN